MPEDEEQPEYGGEAEPEAHSDGHTLSVVHADGETLPEGETQPHINAEEQLESDERQICAAVVDPSDENNLQPDHQTENEAHESAESLEAEAQTAEDAEEVGIAEAGDAENMVTEAGAGGAEENMATEAEAGAAEENMATEADAGAEAADVNMATEAECEGRAADGAGAGWCQKAWRHCWGTPWAQPCVLLAPARNMHAYCPLCSRLCALPSPLEFVAPVNTFLAFAAHQWVMAYLLALQYHPLVGCIVNFKFYLKNIKKMGNDTVG